jgi:nucleoside-diphosphate-sugar epimerase
LHWDASKPDGQPRRRIDPSRAEELLGWKASMNFREGLQRTVEWYLTHRDEAEAAPR